MMAMHEMSVNEIISGARQNTLHSTDLIDALLDRIERLEPEIKAWVDVDARGARQAASELDRTTDSDRQPLRGVPIGVKDIIHVAGMQTIAGYAPFRGRVAEQDAAIIARLRSLGAIIVGKTHTTQFALADPAPTTNPWNAERTPGGSSSGSAAAVAAGMVPVTLGTQTAGSVLRPAGYCGIVGFKPTFNWFSREGVLPLAWSLDHLGLLTRSVDDTSLVYTAIVGESAPAPRESPPVIGLVSESLERSEPDVAGHLREYAKRLREAGADVREVSLPVDLDLILAVHHVIMQAEVAALHGQAVAVDPEHYGPQLRNEAQAGQLVPAAFDIHARRLRRRMAPVIDAFLSEFDALLMPTATNVAPPRATTGDRTFQAPWSVLGTPAISLPTGLSTEGLPFASQLIGRRGADLSLLAVAGWCERTLGLIARPDLG